MYTDKDTHNTTMMIVVNSCKAIYKEYHRKIKFKLERYTMKKDLKQKQQEFKEERKKKLFFVKFA